VRDAIRVARQTIESPLGALIAGALPDGICLLEFPEPDRLEPQLAAIRRRLACDFEQGENVHLDHLQRELTAYFTGTLSQFTVPVVTRGTPFQERVWAQLRQIPYGETRSYQELARAIGAPGASRAVGHANGMNPVAIVVPCHRVINKNGDLGGYGGQLWRKEKLLQLEGARLF
jgi:AraC family transcriptional regulator, regulatory protein of adaptative response / methylated-DNA-[protein]-cysteine methyltransferase